MHCLHYLHKGTHDEFCDHELTAEYGNQVAENRIMGEDTVCSSSSYNIFGTRHGLLRSIWDSFPERDLLIPQQAQRPSP